MGDCCTKAYLAAKVCGVPSFEPARAILKPCHVTGRRLTIGCVMVTMPSILVLDEPTTGLGEWRWQIAGHFRYIGGDALITDPALPAHTDSATAYELLQTLSQLAKAGRTIILSIHVPRSESWTLFDQIVLLTKGRIAYSGPRESCLQWFLSLIHI